MSYPGLPKVSAVAMEEPESMEVLRETAAVYEHVINQVQANCETTVTQLGYRSLMSQFFAEWKARAFRLLQERAQAPPATVPVARPAVKPESAKRPHPDDDGAGDGLLLATGEAPAKRAKPEDAGAAPARYGGATGDDDEDDDSSDSDTDGARRREDAASGADEEEGSDAELGPDLDDDDDTNFNEFCSDVADRVVCLYDDVKKTNKKTVLRVSLRDGVIMVRGMPDILFKRITANFKYN